jgi:hypothetical protein
MKNIFKKVVAPSGEQKKLTALESWTVSWTSRYGSFDSDTEKEFEVFTSEKDAKHFKEQLEAAYRLLKHTSQTEVTIKKN